MTSVPISSGFDHLVNSLASSLSNKGSVRASIGGKLYDVTIANASAEDIKALATTVARFVSGIDMDQLETNRLFNHVRHDEKITSVAVRKAKKAESGKTAITVETVDTQQRKKSYTLFTGGKDGDAELSSFSLPQAIEGVKKVQIQFTPSRTVSIGYDVLAREIAKFSQSFLQAGKSNFEVITGPLAHVIEHTKVTLKDKDSIKSLLDVLAELKQGYDSKKKLTKEEQGFLEALGKYIETLNTFVTELEVFARLERVKKVASSAEQADLLLIERDGKKNNFVVWPADDPSEMHISYQVPGKDSLISTRSSLVDIRKTLSLLEEEISRPSGQESFSTGQSIRHSYIGSRSDLAPTPPPIGSFSVMSMGSMERGSDLFMIEEEPRARSEAITNSGNPEQEQALKKVEKFGTRVTKAAEARTLLNQRPNAWVFWADLKNPSKINFACKGVESIVEIKLDVFDVIHSTFSATKFIALLKQQPTAIKAQLDWNEIEMKFHTLKQF